MSEAAPLQLNYHFERRFQNFRDGKGKVKLEKPLLQWPASDMKSKSQKYLVRNEFAAKPATYSTRMSTDIPLYETPGDEWRVKMSPFKVLALNVWPMVDFRMGCKSKARDYPPQVPQDVTKVLELHTTRRELEGIDNVFNPSHFTLAVKGTLYPDRRGSKSRIRGHCEMNISIVYPLAFTLIPDGVRDTIVKGIMEEVGKRMSQNVDASLFADYTKFKNERSPKRRNFT
ncbi:hypothetical protein V6N13_086771 [Hibiscus sabdariffa]|uniref:Uncharacterized protein n=1 Tax=Hibiscus sabdariffa TaxID=183260 RepID=A0ABR2FUH2_9ROSI